MIELVERHTILAVVVGSRAYGLDGPDSDHDRRGVYAAPTRWFWRLDKPPTHLDGPAGEQFSWEIERFCTLALQANPTVLEVLWSPLVEQVTDDGRQLLAVRRAFLSRRVADTYGRYAQDQKLYAKTGQLKPALYTLRVLLTGIHLMHTGHVETDLRVLGTDLAYLPDLIAAKQQAEHGPLPAGAARHLATDIPRLRAVLEAARDGSPLPEHPDPAAVDTLHDLVVRTRLNQPDNPPPMSSST
ncbi:nucleotidyltransferase domain-containing protein [Phytohabitans houttuyneae]|nr:nucleotidyltransferase domain-containing protein [Phytohabitans houttuyneae]